MYDEKSKSYSNITNVEITAPGLGNVQTLEYIDEGKLYPHYLNFTNYFTKNLSYEPGKDLRGVPYDWRLAPGILCIYRLNKLYNLQRPIMMISLRGPYIHTPHDVLITLLTQTLLASTCL